MRVYKIRYRLKMSPIKSLHLDDSYKYKIPTINLDQRVSY